MRAALRPTADRPRECLRRNHSAGLPTRSTASSQARSRSSTSRASIHHTAGWNQKSASTAMWIAAGEIVMAADMAPLVRDERAQLRGRQAFDDALGKQQPRATDADDARFRHRGGGHDRQIGRAVLRVESQRRRMAQRRSGSAATAATRRRARRRSQRPDGQQEPRPARTTIAGQMPAPRRQGRPAPERPASRTRLPAAPRPARHATGTVRPGSPASRAAPET